MARTKPQTYGAYADCYPVLDRALAAGGARLSFPTLRQAYAYRHRLYRARKLILTAQQAELKPGQIASSAYDTLYLLLEQGGEIVKQGGESEEPAHIVFQTRGASSDLPSRMTDLAGNPLSEPAQAREPDMPEADLLEGLANLKKGLGLE